MTIGPPTAVTAEVTDDTLTVTWTDPDSPDPAIQLYEFYLDSAADVPVNTPTMHTDQPSPFIAWTGDIPNGDHVIYVRGAGDGSPGAWSDPSNSFTVSHPLRIGPPTNVSATVGDGLAIVSWTAPVYQDEPIQYYYVTDSTETTFWPQNDPTQNSLEIDALPNNVPIRFKVRGDSTDPSDNSTITGDYSDLTDWVTPVSALGPVILGVQMPSHGDTGWDIPLEAVLQVIESRLSGATSAPTVVVNSGAGTSVDDPYLDDGSTDTRGTVSFGTGTGVVPGPLVDLTFATPRDTVPVIIVSSNKAGTVPFVTNISTTGFSIGVPYPTDDLNAGHYVASWLVV